MPPFDPDEALIAEGRPSWRSWMKDNLPLAAALMVTVTVLVAVREGELSISQSIGSYVGIVIGFAIFALIDSRKFSRQAWIITNRRVLRSDGTIVQLRDIRRITRAQSTLSIKTEQFWPVRLKYLDDVRTTQSLLERLRA